MSEHPVSSLCISIAFLFLTDKHRSRRGGLGIRVIMSLKHLKASGRPGTERCKGPEEQGRITLLCVPKCLEV